MKPKFDNWTIVIAGQWNPRIFTPAWVGEHLLSVKEVQFEAIFPINQQRLIAQGVVVIPSGGRLVVGVQDGQKATLALADEAARKALDLLSFTPVQAAGINFAFDVSQPSEMLTRVFENLADSGAVVEMGRPVEQVEVHRSFRLDASHLNLRVVRKVDGACEVYLNFHRNVISAKEALKVLKPGMSSYLEQGSDVLKALYGLQLEAAPERAAKDG